MNEKIAIIKKQIIAEPDDRVFLGPTIKFWTNHGSKIDRSFKRSTKQYKEVIVNGRLVTEVKKENENDEKVIYRGEIVSPINFWAKWNYLKTYLRVVLEQNGLK